MKVFLNGRTVEEKSVEDLLEPGFLFGWGVFETLRVYNAKISFLSEHLKRLRQGIDFFELMPPDIDYTKCINNLLSENKLINAYVRIAVFKKRKSTGIIIYASEFNYYNDESYKKGFKAIFAPFVRYSKDPFNFVKSISYARNRHAWFLAQKEKKDETIYLNERNHIQEGSRSNIFFIKDGAIFTPSSDCGILGGVTKAKVIDNCRNLGFNVSEGEFIKEDLLSSDEAFLTSSLMEVMPLVECDNKKIGAGSPGQLTVNILNEYRNKISTQNF
ncbi:MAG: aminotransferase class IV [Candidatus Omnitrophota bacterium]